jgi:hypothetical protein
MLVAARSLEAFGNFVIQARASSRAFRLAENSFAESENATQTNNVDI